MNKFHKRIRLIILFLLILVYPIINLSADEASFKIKCSKCHPLPSPLAFSSSEWAKVVDRMAKNVPLTDVEREYIINLNSTVFYK